MVSCGQAVALVLAVLLAGAALDVRRGVWEEDWWCVWALQGCRTAADVAVRGDVEPGYESVREVFAQMHADGLELGSTVAASVNGREVFSLVAGRKWPVGVEPPSAASSASASASSSSGSTKDTTKKKKKNGGGASKRELFNPNTVMPVFSTSKGMASLAVCHLFDNKKIDLAAPVAKYWPEFAAEGKENITVRDVLKHEAGLLSPEQTIDWEYIESQAVREERLAKMKPRWEHPRVDTEEDSPDSPRAYSAIVHGDILNAIVRRADTKKRLIGKYLSDEIMKPLGIDKLFHLGRNHTHLKKNLALPYDLPKYDRFVRSILPSLLGLPVRPEREANWMKMFVNKDKWMYESVIDVFNHTALGSEPGTTDIFRDRRFLTREFPSATVLSNAKAINTVYSMLSLLGSVPDGTGRHLLSARSVHECFMIDTDIEPKFDKTFQVTNTWTEGGFGKLDPPEAELPPGMHLLGWPGLGGSVGGMNHFFPHPNMDDYVIRISFAYTMNGLGFSADERWIKLYKAFIRALEDDPYLQEF